MALSAWLPLATVLVAIIGAFVAALKFPQERATAIIGQQSTVLADMRTLNEDLNATATRVRAERDDLLKQVTELTLRIQALETQIRQLRAELAQAVMPRRVGDARNEREGDQ